MAILSDQPGLGAIRLAGRLRDLREGAPVPLTQNDLGQALADGNGNGTVGPAAVSSWENPASGRPVPMSRLDAYARLFCTARSFEGGVHLLAEGELTSRERGVFAESGKSSSVCETWPSAVSGDLSGVPDRCGISRTARASRSSAPDCQSTGAR